MTILVSDPSQNLKFKNQLRRLLLIFLFIFLFLAPSQSKAQLFDSDTESVEAVGDLIFIALPASSLATTVILEDRKGTWQFVKSFALNAAVTYALKYTINKKRPLDGGYQAFPSGHTSVTFQAASFIHRRYGFKYSIPGYILAGVTAYSRVHATRHDGWDVLAGAAVGIGSSFIFTTPYQREHMDLTFRSTNGFYLLGFTYKF